MFFNETCKVVVRALPAEDPLLGEVEVISQARGSLLASLGLLRPSRRRNRKWPIGFPIQTLMSTLAGEFGAVFDRRIATRPRRSRGN